MLGHGVIVVGIPSPSLVRTATASDRDTRFRALASWVRFDLLTPREREVLVLLALGRNQDAIARELVVTPKTVATHIQRVLTKLASTVALRQSPRRIGSGSSP